MNLYGCSCPAVSAIENEAYYGGMTQVFNHAPQTDVLYIDVNSLYPAAMVNIMISLKPAEKNDIVNHEPVNYINNPNDQINPWALYRVSYFEFKKDCYGLLPVRTSIDGLIYPRASR